MSSVFVLVLGVTSLTSVKVQNLPIEWMNTWMKLLLEPFSHMAPKGAVQGPRSKIGGLNVHYTLGRSLSLAYVLSLLMRESVF